jgi:hypothetical protein
MITMLLTFVLIPRRADRQLAQALAALPPLGDTVALLTAQRAARVANDSAAARLRVARASVAQLVGDAPRDSANTTPRVASDTVQALAQQLARVRQAPLVESYRTLAATPALRANGAVRATLDSIELLHREREASAALGGPDARYAALTARLTALGQRLERLAAEVLASRQSTASASGNASANASPNAGASASAEVMAGAASSTALADSTSTLLQSTPLVVDSTLDSVATHTAAALARADSMLTATRARNDTLLAQQMSLRERTQLSIPPVAMLLASLVIGLSLGFAVALFREMRRPTVGDADELEALTQARVLGHDEVRGAETWMLLHLSLTNIGDVVHAVQVLADRPLLAGTAALNLAAAAARESRASVVVDLATKSAAVLPLVPTPALRARRDGAAAPDADHPAAAGDATSDSAWDVSRAMRVGRDASVALVLPRRVRSGGARSGGAREADADIARFTAGYDLAIFVADAVSPPALPSAAAVILCARRGVTSLGWLEQASRTLAQQGRAVRAVLLWSGELPLVGGVVAD